MKTVGLVKPVFFTHTLALSLKNNWIRDLTLSGSHYFIDIYKLLRINRV